MARLPRAAPFLALVALLGSLTLALCVGRIPLAPGEVLAALAQGLGLADGAVEPRTATVVWHLRLPRVLAGALVGAALAAAGAAYQALFRNPLASPDLLGVSSGAALGAASAIVLGLPLLLVQGFAFAGGIGAVAIVVGVAAATRGHDPVLTLVLAGVAIGALLGAGVALLKVLADPYNQLPAITFWLLGSLTGAAPGDLRAALPPVAAALAVLWLLRWRINVLSLGEDEARALGVDPARIRLAVVAVATLCTAAAVAIAGIVGWIGLLVPHAARLAVGPDFRRLLPVATLGGAAFLVLADSFARGIAPIEVPLGVVTAVAGAPFFLWLLSRAGRSWT
jgi:iron complex transport system permease protein